MTGTGECFIRAAINSSTAKCPRSAESMNAKAEISGVLKWLSARILSVNCALQSDPRSGRGDVSAGHYLPRAIVLTNFLSRLSHRKGIRYLEQRDSAFGFYVHCFG